MLEPLNILVVDDDAGLRDAIKLILQSGGHQTHTVEGGPQALETLKTRAYNLVLTDLRMDPMDGLTLLANIRSEYPQLPVLLMTAFGDVDKAVNAMRLGACDFLMKPFEPTVLLESIRRYASIPPSQEDMIAVDPATRNVLQMAAKVAQTEATVLLTGESGVGKEVFARYIHEHSARKNGPFVAINCAAIPENLLEATLFGFEKGSFTGAQTAQAGKFEQADKGTILLDEISEMPLGLQAKLLRVLQEREVERVGGKKPISLDIRVLATSNRDMLAEARAGRFREDLYYRLNVFPLEIPSLRDRVEDIAPLARHFLQHHAERVGRRGDGNSTQKAAILTAEAAAVLAAWHWPGNVRELENVMQRALILAQGDTVGADEVRMCLPKTKASTPVQVVSEAIHKPNINSDPDLDAPIGTPSATNMKDLEREHILSTLRSVGGSRKKAVEKLGISERTLRYKLQQYKKEGVTDI